MGMSASQARLIALTARMSDVEYEGQQINQQRLAISNKISDIYAQLEAMIVPTPPSPYDYMKTVYTGTSANTGKQYEVSVGENGNFTVSKKVPGTIIEKTATPGIVNTNGVNIKGEYVTITNAQDNAYGLASQDDDGNYVNTDFYVDTTELDIEEFTKYDPQDFLVETEVTINEPAANDKGLENATQVYKVNGEWQEEEPDAGVDCKTGYIGTTWKQAESFEEGKIYKVKDNAKNKYTSNGEAVESVGGETALAHNKEVDARSSKAYVTVNKNGEYVDYTGNLPPTTGVKLFEKISNEDYKNLENKGTVVGVADTNEKTKLTADDLKGLYIVENGYATLATAENALNEDGSLKIGLSLLKKSDDGSVEVRDAVKSNHPTVNNSQTMPISEAISQFGSSENEAFGAALAALKHTVDEEDVDDYSVIISDDGKSFSFCMTYDLGNGDASADVYVVTSGEFNQDEEGDVIMDPSTGNPKSVKLASGETVNLHMESVTDDNKKALLQYKYECEKNEYDEAQDALNKKTSTYQLEDKKLDLKLKRLDTERNALNTEIDAVKKVIQDATDKGFKTFSG